MEKAVAGFGFIMFCFFFFVGFCTVNTWLWGCIPSLIVMLFGWWFWED